MRAALLMVAVVVSGCGMSHRVGAPAQKTDAGLPAHVDDPLLAVAEYEERIAALEAGLPTAVEAAPSPSAPIERGDVCESACARQAAICELAARICAISERNDAVEGLGARCEDAERRCGNAKALVTDSCVCQ
jgi:hypothetical protein